MKRAVIYARFSSNKQHQTSILAQLDAGRSYCKRQGYLIVGEYIDEAESGRSTDRTNYQRLLQNAQLKQFDVVVFHKIDRNARNESDYYATQSFLRKCGVRTEYCEQRFDETADGRMQEGINVVVSAFYSRNLARETLKTLNLKAKNAEFNGGVPPFGYKVEGKNYVIDEHEAEAIKAIFKMYLEGYGYTKIIHWLNTNGYKTRRGLEFKKTSIHDLLKNDKYIGHYVYGKVQRNIDGVRSHNIDENRLISSHNTIPAIIDMHTWESVQMKMKNNKNATGAYRATREYLLSGKIFCSCGTKMIGKTTNRKDYVSGEYSRYYCPSKECSIPAIRRSDIEDIVYNHINEVLSNPVNRQKLIHGMLDIYSKSNPVDNTKQLEKDLQASENALSNLYSALSINPVMDEFDAKALAEAKNKVLDKKRNLEQAKAKQAQFKMAESNIVELIKKFLTTNEKQPDIRRAAITAFLYRVTINEDEINIDLIFQDNVPIYMVPRTGIEPVRRSLSEGF